MVGVLKCVCLHTRPFHRETPSLVLKVCVVASHGNSAGVWLKP